MQETTNEPSVIPYAAHEAQMERNAKQVRLLTKIIGVMALLMFLMAVMFTYGWEEEVTTTTTTETTEYADSGDYGNAIVGDGDISIGNGVPQDSYNNDNDGQA